MNILNFILTVLTTIAAGGWFIYYKANRRKEYAKAKKEESEAKVSEVNLTNEIFEKYQKVVLDAMGGHEERHKMIERDIKEIKKELKNINGYLNGDYKNHKNHIKDVTL